MENGGVSADVTRERILDVALELFTSKGYEKTSLREIAERMGFSKAALYYHFPSKSDILLALHMRLHALGRESFGDLDTERVSPQDWPRLLDRLIDKMLDNRALFVLHMRNHAALEEIHHEAHDADHKDLEERIRSMIADSRTPVAQRVRLSCALGAIFSGLFVSAEAFREVGTAELGSLIHDAVHDLIAPVVSGALAHAPTR